MPKAFAVLTLLFRWTFYLQIDAHLVCFSSQSLIKKDRQDKDGPTLSEFFDKLVTAYEDPALTPIQYSTNSDGLHSPLISSSVIWVSESWGIYSS